MQEMKPIKEGKVREIYDNGDSLVKRCQSGIFLQKLRTGV